MSYETLQKSITQWAAAQDDMQALVLIGSRARTDHPPDTWSDLDLILFVTDPQSYVDDASWIQAFGQVWLHQLNFTGIGDPEWMVLYAGGFKVDFILTPAAGGLSDTLSNPLYIKAVRRGMHVLLDKTGDERPEIDSLRMDQPWERPNAAEFAALLQKFWLSIYRASSMVQRGELWRARRITDDHVRQQLLQMLEWHAKAKQGGAFDTWYQGRFLADWVEPHFWAQLAEIFATFDSSATRCAMMASMTLMDSLGRETAEIWGYPYPIPNQTDIRDWIKSALAAV